jgi:hypothetical protein
MCELWEAGYAEICAACVCVHSTTGKYPVCSDSSMLLNFHKTLSIDFRFNDETIFYIETHHSSFILQKKKLLITTVRTKINSQYFKKAWKHEGAHDTFPRAPPRTQWPTDPSACHSEKLMMVHHRYVPLLCQMVQWAALLNCTYAS